MRGGGAGTRDQCSGGLSPFPGHRALCRWNPDSGLTSILCAEQAAVRTLGYMTWDFPSHLVIHRRQEQSSQTGRPFASVGLMHHWGSWSLAFALYQPAGPTAAPLGSLLGGKTWNQFLGFSCKSKDFKSQAESAVFWGLLSTMGITQSCAGA